MGANNGDQWINWTPSHNTVSASPRPYETLTRDFRGFSEAGQVTTISTSSSVWLHL